MRNKEKNEYEVMTKYHGVRSEESLATLSLHFSGIIAVLHGRVLSDRLVSELDAKPCAITVSWTVTPKSSLRLASPDAI